MNVPIQLARRVMIGSAMVLYFSLPGVARAGSICGTVRDSQTAAAVPLAGIFVRTVAGAYTGHHAATDSTGAYCVVDVPPGTYDLEIRVNRYELAYARNVVVTDGATHVDTGAVPARFYLAPPSPNPSRASVSFELSIDGETPVELAVYDLSGRLLRRWGDQSPGPGERSIQWNFQDSLGRTVPPGIYFAQLRAGSVRLTRTFVRID